MDSLEHEFLKVTGDALVNRFIEEASDRLVRMYVIRNMRRVLGAQTHKFETLADDIATKITGDSYDTFVVFYLRDLLHAYADALTVEELDMFVEAFYEEGKKDELVERLLDSFTEENLDAEWQRQLTKLRKSKGEN